MTFPQVADQANRASVAQESTVVADLPSGIQEGDLLLLLSGQHLGSTGGDDMGTLPGWSAIWRSADAISSNDIYSFGYIKIADGTETGQVFVNGGTLSGSCATVLRITGSDQYTAPFCGAGAGGTSGADPNPPSRTAPWGADDNLWLIWATGDGASAFSGTPQNGDAQPYSGLTYQVANIATRANAAAFGWTQRNAATEDPTAFTRVSEDHEEQTVVVRPAQPVATHARVRHRCTKVQKQATTGSPFDFTVRVEGGANTRIVAIICVSGMGSTALTVTLDPTGANIPLTLCGDGTDAFTTQSTARIWTTIDAQNLAPGNYTLRVSGLTPVKTLWWFEIEGTPDDNVLVRDVRLPVTGSSSSNTVDTTIDGDAGGLIIAHIYGSWSFPSWAHTFNGVRPMAFGDGLTGATESQVIIGRAVAGSNALHFEHGSDSGGNTLTVAAVSLGYVPASTNPQMHGCIS